jgi:hypothetical protein
LAILALLVVALLFWLLTLPYCVDDGVSAELNASTLTDFLGNFLSIAIR